MLFFSEKIFGIGFQKYGNKGNMVFVLLIFEIL